MPSGGKGPTCPPLRPPFFPLEIPATFSASNPRDSPLSLKTSRANIEALKCYQGYESICQVFVRKIRKLFRLLFMSKTCGFTIDTKL